MSKLKRFVGVAAFRATSLFRRRPVGSPGEPVFLVAHYNAADFLAANLNAIRRWHPHSRVVVADSTSQWSQYQAAKAACKKYGAEMHPRLPFYRHTAQLNYLLRQARCHQAIFLDQDCLPLADMAPVAAELNEQVLMVGPEEYMMVDHPNYLSLQSQQPGLFRDQAGYIHASFMAVDALKILSLFGNDPFTWSADFGAQPLEKYYGLCHRLLTTRPGSMKLLGSAHTGYGLGMVYFHDGRPVAYHNWYSGRIHDDTGDFGSLIADPLRRDMARFLADYWNDSLNFDIQNRQDAGPAHIGETEDRAIAARE